MILVQSSEPTNHPIIPQSHDRLDSTTSSPAVIADPDDSPTLKQFDHETSIEHYPQCHIGKVPYTYRA